MRTIRAVFHLLRADYLERVRSSAFLIILAIVVFAGYFYTPSATSGYRTLSFGAEEAGTWYRGIYNSAWIATQVALWATLWLLLTGFFLVRNSVERDIRTGVGQIIATTPLTRLGYTLGKMLSNLATLLTMLVVIIISTGVMQFLRGEYPVLNLWQLISPFLLMTVPTIAVVSALAILFECIKFLRGTVGSIIYFFFTLAVILVSTGLGQQGSSLLDMLGMSQVLQQMESAVRAAFPHFVGEVNIGTSEVTMPPQTFVWDGIHWTGGLLTTRLFWLACAFVIPVVAAVFFSRFDPAKEHKGRAAQSASPVPSEPAQEMVEEAEPVRSTVPATLTPLTGKRVTGWGAQVRVLVGELKMQGKEVPWWWYIGALVWIGLQLFLPYTVAYGFFLPIAWLWPLPIWSSLGSRERQQHTNQLVFSCESVLGRQFPMHYLAGVIVTLFAASGLLVRVLLTGSPSTALVILMGALFIPALALCLGVWTSGRRLFEMIYLALWYVGAINRTSVIDFMGITSDALVRGIPYIFAGIALVLVLLAFLGRSRQMQI